VDNDFTMSQSEKLFESYRIILKGFETYFASQNGVVERANRELKDRVQCVLIKVNLNKAFWEYAAYYAAYVMNRMCKKGLLWKSSFELFHGKRPKLRHLRDFGCDSYYVVPEQVRCDKLSPRGQ
jgi:hypothetical protein